MIWCELSETLADLVGSITATDGTGLVITGAELRIPLEVRTETRDGCLVVFAQPPHTRWKSGFLPLTHTSRLVIGPEEEHAG